MLKPIPFAILNPPLLSSDRQAYVDRAHRLRAAAVASLVRDIARWVGGAAR
jgi:hypothetical protein